MCSFSKTSYFNPVPILLRQTFPHLVREERHKNKHAAERLFSNKKRREGDIASACTEYSSQWVYQKAILTLSPGAHGTEGREGSREPVSSSIENVRSGKKPPSCTKSTHSAHWWSGWLEFLLSCPSSHTELLTLVPTPKHISISRKSSTTACNVSF